MILTKFICMQEDLSEPKYEYLIKKRDDAGIKHLNNPNEFIECSNRMDDVYGNINDYNLIRKRKKIIVFDDMIAHIMTNKRFLSHNQRIVYLSYFSVPKDVTLNTTHYFVMKINNKRELQNIAINHSADIDYQDFKKIYRECTREPLNFLTIDTTLLASDPLRFRKNLFTSYKNDNN